MPAEAAGESRTEDYTQIPPEGEEHCNHNTLEGGKKHKTCNSRFKREYEIAFVFFFLPATYLTLLIQDEEESDAGW